MYHITHNSSDQNPNDSNPKPTTNKEIKKTMYKLTIASGPIIVASLVTDLIFILVLNLVAPFKGCIVIWRYEQKR